ncbi:uncharacterized protein FIBRA_01975 [Fibroporia radiculosa]|uniref:B30.2/SPRY domain-containing protein n=1 Tax=Fibroporia radiculosa TaxID=599839 RepID=J4GM05_9APHY|nr:uncharacterized protein FIBRA_01975 [Fibroporia radiculosa]CCL99950.1 predicted protein [Fibroporia radiculosa]
MSSRSSRSASIPIPAGSSHPARSMLDDAIPIPFARSNNSVNPARRASAIAGSPEDRRRRGPSLSPVRSTISTSPSVRPIVGSYSSIASSTGRGLRPGAHPNSPTNISPAASFQPRIIRAASSPVAQRDPAACLPAPSVPEIPALTSPIRPRRLSAGPRSGLTPSAPRLSASLPAGMHVDVVPNHSILTPPAHAHNSNSFPRPAYLEYSALRDLLLAEPVVSPHVYRTSTISAPVASHGQAPRPGPYPYLRRSLTPVMDSGSEGTHSPSPPPQAPSTTTGQRISMTDFRLPTRWSEHDRAPQLSVSADGRELTFTGHSFTGDRDAAAARANHWIPPACGIYYYEVEILHRGSKGHISIGFSAPNVRLVRLPGLEPLSWGYHADDGWVFAGQKDGSPYGPTYDSGDVIGCGIDFSQSRVFFTKNGALLNSVFDNLPRSGVNLHPAVGLRHTAEAIRVNFGSAPFRYAITDHVRAQRDQIWGSIVGTEDGQGMGKSSSHEDGEKRDEMSAILESSKEKEEASATMQNLISAYLSHHGYARTARAFREQCTKSKKLTTTDGISVKNEEADVAMETEETPGAGSSRDAMNTTDPATSKEQSHHVDPETEDLQNRLSILQAVRTGDVDVAIEGLRMHHPQALEAQEGLLYFRLRCRKFVELVLKAGEATRRAKEATEREKNVKTAEKMHRGGTGGGAEYMLSSVDENGAELDGEGAMDVDDPSPDARVLSTASDQLVSASDLTSAITEQARAALHTALSYGQGLEADFKSDTREVVRTHLRRTFGLVAYEDPEREGGEVGAMAGQEARVELAGEVNQAILESQGRPVHPALETIFRQAGACVTQLGLMGCGPAAFVDVRREFLET